MITLALVIILIFRIFVLVAKIFIYLIRHPGVGGWGGGGPTGMSYQPISAPFLFCSLSLLDHTRACYYFNVPNFRFGRGDGGPTGMQTDTATYINMSCQQ